jgi:hypothetical protein
MAASSRRAGGGARLRAGEQVLGLLEAPLADPQVGQPQARRPGHRAVPALEDALGGEQLPLSLVPAADRREDRPVVHPAGGPDEGAPGREARGGRHPLLRSLDVGGTLAGPEQPAVDLCRGVDAAHLARRHGRHGLVEQRHPVLHPALDDERMTAKRLRGELQLTIGEAAGDRPGLQRAPLALLGVLDPGRAVQRQPAVLDPLLDALEQPRGARHPAIGRRSVPAHSPVQEREPARDVGRLGAQAGAVVGDERALRELDRLVGRAGGERLLEARPRGVPVGGVQRLPAATDEVAGHGLAGGSTSSTSSKTPLISTHSSNSEMRCSRASSARIVSGSSRAASYSSGVPSKKAMVRTWCGLSWLRMMNARS